MKEMKKLSSKVLSFSMFVILGLGSLITVINVANAQVTTKFGDPTSTSNVGVSGTGTLQADKLITVIKSFINWMLGILALVALVILLWGGFQMVTAAGDDAKYKKGFKILQQAAIGLVFIWVSRLVVSVIFWLLWIVGVS